VNLPFIGSVEVANKTADQIDQEITSALNNYFRNIDIMVNIKDPVQRSVYVVGQVRNPGRFEFEYGDRVIHALGRAGGMQDHARENGLVLVRREPDGRDHAYRLDFSSVHRFIAPGDIHLQPSDVVFVPKDRFSTFSEFATGFLDVINKALTSGVLVDQLLRERTISITTSP
jgi:polysaccharide export outer membrane protein